MSAHVLLNLLNKLGTSLINSIIHVHKCNILFII